jgi:hypothetical protein
MDDEENNLFEMGYCIDSRDTKDTHHGELVDSGNLATPQ